MGIAEIKGLYAPILAMPYHGDFRSACETFAYQDAGTLLAETRCRDVSPACRHAMASPHFLEDSGQRIVDAHDGLGAPMTRQQKLSIGAPFCVRDIHAPRFDLPHLSRSGLDDPQFSRHDPPIAAHGFDEGKILPGRRSRRPADLVLWRIQ